MKKMSRVLSLFLMLAITVGTFGGTAAFATSNDNDYLIENGVLIGYSGSDTNVIIPDGVTEIADKAFSVPVASDTMFGEIYEGYPITSVKIPGSVKKIGEHAFDSCEQLTRVELSEGLTSIGYRAFYSCKNLNYINYPNSLTTIGDMAFGGCSSITAANFGSDLVSIGDSAFSDCEKLTSASGSNVTSLGGQAFQKCTNLSNVNFPNPALSCGNSVFIECTSLKSITLNGTKFGDTTFMDCGLSSLSVFHGLKLITPYMFQGNNFTNLIIPSTVTSIGEYAFGSYLQGCDYVIVPDSVTSIGTGAFSTDTKGGWTAITELSPGHIETAAPTYTTIYGVAGSAAEAYAKKSGNPFVAITREQANSGRISGGSFTLDTTNYTMAPGNTYQIGAKAAGMAGTTVKYYSSSSGVAGVTKLSNGNYQIKGMRPGTTYIMFDVMRGSVKVGHISVRVDVKKSVKQHGDAKRCTLQLN